MSSIEKRITLAIRVLNEQTSTDAKQKIKENLTLYRFHCETIVVCGKTRPKK